MLLEDYKKLIEGFNPDKIIDALGGYGKLSAMIGANSFGYSKNYTAFKFKGSKKANYVKITLNSKDLYDIEFKKIWGNKIKDVAEFKDVYVSDLKNIFENVTELYLSI